MPKKKCRYGRSCYRKNDQHLRDYDHGSGSESGDEVTATEPDSLPEPPKKKSKITEFFKSQDDKVKEVEVEESADICQVEEDSIAAPASPADVKENIKSKFGVEMPEDFYEFWQFAESLNKKNPTDALKKELGLQLVGPFDILAGKKSSLKKPCWFRHWRYYYDPPEFLTILRGNDDTQFHMGYFRDDPKEMPVFVASNEAKVNCNIVPRGENIFAAVIWFIEDAIRKSKSNKSTLNNLKSKVEKWASKCDFLTAPGKSKAMKARDKKSVCATFHGAGLVVPVDEHGVGYREVPETTADLKKMLKNIVVAKDVESRNKATDPLMEIVMLVQFANDECDYGEGLELGLCMFSFGGECLHKMILNLMPLAYQLLKRNLYADCIKAHLEDRKHSTDLSQL
ncbi:hypothetical protein CAPTEDRAFT_108777 [Capitella teleta]|uniref:PBZ-type domain-containing protein n=1 Tax=Capitella teleta TaxID=283909 RepID=R7T774_CAPTE|nr:hypothetical protein CAPTEDRAFT_108777 [Capitella teleta]|eukprot:ELT89494.1 hypothetical protein CAPTEDRAFT_108777 [Capitella teleta]